LRASGLPLFFGALTAIQGFFICWPHIAEAVNFFDF